MRWYQRLSIKLSLPILLSVSLFIIAGVVLYLTFSQRNAVRKAEDTRNLKVDSTFQKLETTHRLMLDKVQTAMKILKKEGLALGKPTYGGTTKPGGITSFDLKFGNASLANNTQFIDRISEITGSSVTIFVKSGENFTRFATNIQKGDGPRAVGSILDPNHKAFNMMKQGKPYYGAATILDRPYITGYEPMFDESNEVIGVWAFSYPIDSMKELEQSLAETTIFEKGFLALVDDKGQIVFKTKDADENLVKKAAAITGEDTSSEWQIRNVKFEPWDYTIVSGYTVNDPVLVQNSRDLLYRVGGGAALFIIFLTFLVLFLTRRFLSPLENAVNATKRIAQGNLNIPDEYLIANSNDEVGELTRSLQSMVSYLKEMSDVADKISEGNLNVQVKPRSNEDRFGLAFKNMLERTLRLVQTQDERNLLQNSILKLLNEVSDAANGDLTAQAEVSADATGAIADAFNHMILELRRIISQVKSVTLQVDHSTGAVRVTTEDLSRDNEEQTKQITRAAGEIEEMVSSIKTVSENIKISKQVTEQSLQNARHGTQAVQSNINAMNRIHQQVQETAKRVQRLGERSQEIGDIVKVIDDLAYRTGVLALNASIQAQAAGDAGRGFVVVAEEVERLAERSANATKQISALTKAIQAETTEVVGSIEETIKEVTNGSKLANEVGFTLSEIEKVANQLAEINLRVSTSAELQNQRSMTIYQTMREVAAISEKNNSGVKKSAQTITELALLAKDLRSSVASFKLPPEYEFPTLVNSGAKNFVSSNKPHSETSFN